MSFEKFMVHWGKQTLMQPTRVQWTDNTGKVLPWLRSWQGPGFLAPLPLESVVWIMQCVVIKNLIHTSSPVIKPPLASTPLADDPHSIPYCEIEAIGRQLPHFPTLQWRQVLPPLGVNPSPDLQWYPFSYPSVGYHSHQHTNRLKNLILKERIKSLFFIHLQLHPKISATLPRKALLISLHPSFLICKKRLS